MCGAQYKALGDGKNKNEMRSLSIQTTDKDNNNVSYWLIICYGVGSMLETFKYIISTLLSDSRMLMLLAPC